MYLVCFIGEICKLKWSNSDFVNKIANNFYPFFKYMYRSDEYHYNVLQLRIKSQIVLYIISSLNTFLQHTANESIRTSRKL